MNDLKALAERLKTQAPHCSFTWGEDGLRVQSPCGEVRAAGDRVLFLNKEYRNLRMADDASLYNAVERFTQCLQAGGAEKDRPAGTSRRVLGGDRPAADRAGRAGSAGPAQPGAVPFEKRNAAAR